MPRATCDDCNYVYEVPDATRTYRCKECGGSVSADVDEFLADQAACGECNAIQIGPPSRYCNECGAPLNGASESTVERRERQRVAKELNKAKEWVRTVRLIYGVGAFASGLQLVFVTLAAIAATKSQQAEVSPGVIYFAVAILGGVFAVYVAGAMRIFREPLLWATLIAGLQTVQCLMSLVEGNWLVAIILAFWSALLWFIVTRISRVHRWIEEYPQLWHSREIARARSKARRADRDPSSLEAGIARERRQHAEKRIRRKQILAIAATITTLTLLGFVWKATHKPPTFEETLVKFCDDWNRSDREAVASWFIDERQDKIVPYLSKKNSNRDWSEELPDLQTRLMFQETSDKAAVTYSTIDGDVLTVWTREGGSWRIRSIKID